MKLTARSGFTLIEIMLATTIMGIVVAVSALFWHFISKNMDFSLTQYRLTEQASRAITTMTTEIRQAEEAMNGAYLLAIPDDDQLTFYADTDNNGSVERVHYFVDNNRLMKGVTEASGNPPDYQSGDGKVTTIVDALAPGYSPIFRYYNETWPQDQTGNPIPAATRQLDTRMISIRIPVILVDQGQTSTHSAESLVYIRNLKRNL